MNILIDYFHMIYIFLSCQVHRHHLDQGEESRLSFSCLPLVERKVPVLHRIIRCLSASTSYPRQTATRGTRGNENSLSVCGEASRIPAEGEFDRTKKSNSALYCSISFDNYYPSLKVTQKFPKLIRNVMRQIRHQQLQK